MKKQTKLKKAATSVLLVLCVAALAACGQKPAEPAGQTPAASNGTEASSPAKTGETPKPAETPKASTASEIFMKSMEVTAKLDSYTVNMNAKQNIEQGANKMDIQSKIDMDVVMKPQMSFKQTMSMNMMGQDMKMEIYMTKDGIFMKESTTGQWMKLPQEQIDQVMGALSSEQLDPAKQFEKLKEFANDFTMTESGDTYTVVLSANGDKFNDFIQKEIQNNMGSDPAMQEVVKQAASGMKITKMEYSFTIDKKTYYPKNMKVNMDFDMDVQGQKMRMIQAIDGTYANYNGVKEITVPKEALEAPAAG